MKTPKEKDRIEAVILSMREAEQYVDPFIEKVKKSDDPNSFTDEAASLIRIIAKARFENAVEQGESEVLKYIDDLENVHYYNKNDIEEKLREWMINICVRPPYRAATSESPEIPFHWVIKQKLVFEESKQNFINTAVGIFNSGIYYRSVLPPAKNLIDKFYLAQYNFLNDCYHLIVLDSIVTTINKYLSGKLPNESTAKAKPSQPTEEGIPGIVFAIIIRVLQEVRGNEFEITTKHDELQKQIDKLGELNITNTVNSIRNKIYDFDNGKAKAQHYVKAINLLKASKNKQLFEPVIKKLQNDLIDIEKEDAME